MTALSEGITALLITVVIADRDIKALKHATVLDFLIFMHRLTLHI